MLLSPFAALRPAPGREADVVASPYDVVTAREARERAAGNPWSFLHVSRPEIDLADDADPYCDEAYAKAAENFGRMIASGVLQRDEEPCYYLYRVSGGGHSQTGIVATASLADYEANRVRRHELTTAEKEDDRVRHMEALNAQTGPIMAAYPEAPALDAIIASANGAEPDADAIEGDTRHTLWVLRDPDVLRRITKEFDALQAIYIADGHHRSAAASRVARARRSGRKPNGDAPHERLLMVVFPEHEMRILAYNRVLASLGGLSATSLLRCARERFTVEQSTCPARPARPGQFGLFVDGHWYRLTVRPELKDPEDPLARLDVRVLSDHLLQPAGITDNGRDKRVAYVGGARGLEELERQVCSGEMAAAVALYPTQISDVKAVADAGGVMPPKSTWFDPKLADGLVSHLLG
jgi:uncharacterized protein (DUF1015 family)